MATSKKTAQNRKVQKSCGYGIQRTAKYAKYANPEAGGRTIWIVRVFRVFRGYQYFFAGDFGHILLVDKRNGLNTMHS